MEWARYPRTFSWCGLWPLSWRKDQSTKIKNIWPKLHISTGTARRSGGDPDGVLPPQSGGHPGHQEAVWLPGQLLLLILITSTLQCSASPRPTPPICWPRRSGTWELGGDFYKRNRETSRRGQTLGGRRCEELRVYNWAKLIRLFPRFYYTFIWLT